MIIRNNVPEALYSLPCTDAGAGAHGRFGPGILPRAYWPAPVGTKLLISGNSYSSGDALLDPTIPIYGVVSRINRVFLGYMQTFALAGRNANLVLEAPYSWGVTRGLLELDAAAMP